MSKKKEDDYSLVDEVVQSQKHPSTVGYEKEDAYQTLERVNFWLNSFDAKASYLLTIISIVGTIFFSSDYFNNVDLTYWETWHCIVSNLLYLSIVISFLISIGSLIWCISPKLKNMKPLKSEAKKTHTVLFYGSISDMKDKTQEIARVKQFDVATVIDDINNQAYYCSTICIGKKNKICFAIIGILVCIGSLLAFDLIKRVPVKVDVDFRPHVEKCN